MTQEIQHLYRRNKSGSLVFQESAVVETDGSDKTSVVHLEILPDPLPTRKQVFQALLKSFEVDTKLGILPEYYAALQ